MTLKDTLSMKKERRSRFSYRWWDKTGISGASYETALRAWDLWMFPVEAATTSIKTLTWYEDTGARLLWEKV
jgi:hypothetical protein